MGYIGKNLIPGDRYDPKYPLRHEREMTWVRRVVEAPGTTAETLHTSDGHTIKREGQTVFATEEEAREDARRLMEEGRVLREKGGKR